MGKENFVFLKFPHEMYSYVPLNNQKEVGRGTNFRKQISLRDYNRISLKFEYKILRTYTILEIVASFWHV